MRKGNSLVLFDIDGTLIRGAGLHHKAALIEGIRKVTGIITSLDGVATQGALDRDLIRGMLRASGYSERGIRSLLRDIMHECQNAYFHNCAVDLKPNVCVGVRDIVNELKQRGAVLGLVSGNLTRIGWRKVELAGMGEYFSVGAFAEDGRTRARLARVAAQRAIRTGLVGRSCRVSLIGDHANDVVAAKANSFHSVAVATGLMPIEELRQAQPDILVRDLRELNIEALCNGVQT